MENLFYALKATPWWIYILFGYLISVGVRALNPRVLSINKMFILPLILGAWSIYSLFSDLRYWWELLVWASAILVGFLIGLKLVRSLKKMKVDKKKLLVHIQGSYQLLVLIVVVFIVKYFFGYFKATHPFVSLGMHLLGVLASGAVTGIFFGRLVGFIRVFKDSKHQSLKKNSLPRKKKLL